MALRDPETVDPARLEHDVQTLAREIAAAGASERASLFHLGRWSERVLDWAMFHPTFKTQLFRFVDVFPGCRDDADVLRHLREYFAEVPAPRALRLGLEVAERIPLGAHVSTAAARRNVLRMARQLIAGATPADALPRLEHLWRAGEASTVDLLGEKTVTKGEAARYAGRVEGMLEALVVGTRAWPGSSRPERDPWGPIPRVNVSVKPTALSPRFAPTTAKEGIAEARARLLPILRRAREAGATIHLDMEQDDAKDTTLALLRTLGAEFPDGPQLGCVIQAYRKDAFGDLSDVVAWSERTLRMPLVVRLVKGAYWDYETVIATAEGWPVPVFQVKAETDASYERCIRHLIDHAGKVRPAFGSHNLRSIAYAIAYGQARGLPVEAVERLIGAIAIVPVGHARDLRTVVGPLIDEEAYRRVTAYAHDEGVVYRRDDVPTGGWYVGPTIIVTKDPRARAASEEVFGPVLVVLRADDFEHALALANDTDYALTGGVFSRSPVNIRRAAEELRAGNVYVNRGITGARVGRQPFGGHGLSGVGSKAGGPDYLLQFVESRVVTENAIRQGFAGE
jgi:hypothetical protein